MFPRSDLTNRKSVVKTIVLSMVIFMFHAYGQGQTTSNLTLFQNLARTAGKEAAERLSPSDSSGVALIIHPEANAWILKSAFAEGVERSGRFTVRLSAFRTLEIVAHDLSVGYRDQRRDGMFGDLVVDRVVHLGLTASTSSGIGAVSLSPYEFDRTVCDTIRVSSISSVEESSVSATHGVLPPEEFFDWFLEPLILMGAIAVSIYLFFHVRS